MSYLPQSQVFDSRLSTVPRKVWALLIQLGIAILVIAAGFQIGIDASTDNLICVFLALVCPLIVATIVFRLSVIRVHPLPAISVVLFVFANMTLPLLVKTVELEPLIFNLKIPTLTFGLMTLTAMVLTASYLLYARMRVFGSFRAFLTTRVLMPMSAYRTPATAQLWMMGFIGIIAYVYVLLTGTLYAKAGNSDQTAVKFVQAFMPFAFAPFLILIPHLYGRDVKAGAMRPFVVVQFLIVAGLGLGQNSRTPMLMPLVNIGVWIALGMITGRTRVTRVGLRNFILIALMAISFAPFAQDLATAMVIVRSSRQKTGPVDLILKSLDYVSHKDELQRKREQSESQKGWSEVYVHNVFLSRFIDVKYHDNSLAIEENLSGSEKDGLNEFAVQKAWSILPTPVANFFGVEINKDTLGKESFGDFLYASSTGQESLGLKAGSYIANGLGLHGLLFFPILALFCVVLFTLFDSFVVKAVEDSQNGGPPTESLLVSPIALLNVYLLCGMFLGLNGHESEVAFLAWIVRDFGQMVILYFVIFKITEGLVFIVTLGSTRRKASRARIRALGRSG